MRIAIFSSGFFPVIDGVSIALLNRLQVLDKIGHQVLLLCPDYSALEPIYPNWQDYTGQILPNVKVVNLPSTEALGLDFERDVNLNAYPIALQELQNFDPDIIHVDEPERLGIRFFKIPGINFARNTQIPCVSFFHTNYLDYIDDYLPLSTVIITSIKWALERLFVKIYNTYDVTLVSSRVTQNKLIKMGIKNTVYAELLGFDSTQFHSELRINDFFQNRYNIAGIENKIKLIFIGRLTPDKGWNFTINALSRLKQIGAVDQVALLIVGEGPLRNQISKNLSPLMPHLHFLGRVNPDQIPALLANSDIHVTTSEKETRGLTLIEALAVGIVVLAPRSGGVIDSIQDGDNGFLYNPQDQDDFLKKLMLLIDNPTLRQEMGKRGQESVADNSWNYAVRRLLKIWERCIKEQAQN